ncbi:MAG: hypothetical protein ACLUS6_12495 [Dysosmobacter sp.]
MLIVTLMLTAIFGMVYHLTVRAWKLQSEAMLQSVASDAFHPNRPGSPPQEVHLPFFVLELDGNGGLTASGGRYCDLTDQEFLKTLADAATDADAPAGVLREYGLRYCRSVTPVESASLSQICPASGPSEKSDGDLRRHRGAVLRRLSAHQLDVGTVGGKTGGEPPGSSSGNS